MVDGGCTKTGLFCVDSGEIPAPTGARAFTMGAQVLPGWRGAVGVSLGWLLLGRTCLAAHMGTIVPVAGLSMQVPASCSILLPLWGILVPKPPLFTKDLPSWHQFCSFSGTPSSQQPLCRRRLRLSVLPPLPGEMLRTTRGCRKHHRALPLLQHPACGGAAPGWVTQPRGVTRVPRVLLPMGDMWSHSSHIGAALLGLNVFSTQIPFGFKTCLFSSTKPGWLCTF